MMKTKIISLSLLFILLLGACEKGDIVNIEQKQETLTVSPKLAKKVALNFVNTANFYKKTTKSTRVLSRTIKSLLTIRSEKAKPLMYAINFSPSGFVIVPATKKETPIIAFSENSLFKIEDKNEGLTKWIDNRKSRIATLMTSKNEISNKIKSEWVTMAPPSGGSTSGGSTSGGSNSEVIVSGGTIHEQKGPFLLTTWDQNKGFNDSCPDLSCTSTSNGKAWAGCAAIAVAQVFKYWNYPTNYSWSDMPNGAGSSEASKLIRDIGDAVNMNYSCSGSAASMSDVQKALVHDFGYSNASLVYFNKNTIVDQLNKDYPVIMSGFNYSGSEGHAWVCDGYERIVHAVIHNPGTYYEYTTNIVYNFYLDMNWGWGGSANGWYLADNDFRNYNYDVHMIINIHP